MKQHDRYAVGTSQHSRTLARGQKDSAELERIAKDLRSNAVVQASKVAEKAVINATQPGDLRITFKRSSTVIQERQLPDYGEVRIITHGGKVTFVETTVKEKVE